MRAWRTTDNKTDPTLELPGSVPISNHRALGNKRLQSLIREAGPFIPSKALKLPFAIRERRTSTIRLGRSTSLCSRGPDTALSNSKEKPRQWHPAQVGQQGRGVPKRAKPQATFAGAPPKRSSTGKSKAGSPPGGPGDRSRLHRDRRQRIKPHPIASGPSLRMNRVAKLPSKASIIQQQPRENQGQTTQRTCFWLMGGSPEQVQRCTTQLLTVGVVNSDQFRADPHRNSKLLLELTSNAGLD